MSAAPTSQTMDASLAIMSPTTGKNAPSDDVQVIVKSAVALDMENEAIPCDSGVTEQKDRHRRCTSIQTANAVTDTTKNDHVTQSEQFSEIYDDTSNNEMESASEGNPIDSAIDDESSIALDDSLDSPSDSVEEEDAEAEARRIEDEERFHLQEFERKMQFFKQSHLAPSEFTSDTPQFHDYAPSNATIQLSATLAPCVLQMQTVMKTVNFIVANHGRVKRLDASIVVELQAVLARLLEAHERFQQICLSGNEDATLKALYCLLNETKSDHQEVTVRWAVMYHSIHEIGEQLAAKLQSGHNYTFSSKTKLWSLFKSHKAATETLSPDECEHWVDALGQAANDWRVMMDNMVPQWKAYKHYARQMHRFAIVVETESIGEMVDGFLRQTFKEARTIFRNSIKLAQLHHQIDYSNLNKEVPKENTLDATAAAAAAAEEEGQLWGSQLWQPQSQTAPDEGPDRHIFAYDVLKKRRHIYHGTLVEHQVSTPAGSSQGGKKSSTTAAPTVQPSSQEMELILTTDLVYIGSRVVATADSASGATAAKTIKLLHEPVGLADTQITCPPDAPPVNENVVIVCFHNTTTYILQAKSAQERDAWIRVARQFSLDKPRPTIESVLDENGMLRNTSTASLTPSMHAATSNASSGNSGGSGVRSLFQRFRSVRRSGGASSTASLNDLAQGEQAKNGKSSQRAGVEELGLRQLPSDRGTVVPVPLHIHLRASVMVERQVRMVDLTTGKTALCEFGLARENYQVNDRVDAGFLMVTLPPVKATQEEYFAANGQGLVAAPYDLNEPTSYYHPLRPEDIFVSTWIHPGLDLQFQPDMVTVSFTNMYKFIFDSPETVQRLQAHYHKLLEEQIQAPDNLFLTMPFRSQAVQVAKRMSRGVTAMNGMHERLEMGRCYIEFRQMSNHPGALSVGFWNPKTRRDMSFGVCPLNLSQMNAGHTTTATAPATAASSIASPISPLTLNSAQSTASPAHAAWNTIMSATAKPKTGTSSTSTAGMVKMQQLITRDSPTELQFRLIQTDVVVKRRAQGGKVVMTTRDSSSLDTYYIQGSREALNEFEEFLRRSLGVACMARNIDETFLLAQVAFDPKVLRTAFEYDERDPRGGRGNRESTYSVRTSFIIVNEEDTSTTTCAELQTSTSDLPSQGHVAKLIKNLNSVNPAQPSTRSFAPKTAKTPPKGLTPVVEELETDPNANSQEGGLVSARTHHSTLDMPDRAAMATTSFQFKSVDALKRMANEAAAADEAVHAKDHNQDLDGVGGVLQIDSSSFGDLTADSLLSSFFSTADDDGTKSEVKAAMDAVALITNGSTTAMSTAPPTSSSYVEVSAFKLHKSRSNLPISCSAMSSTLSIRPQQQQQPPQPPQPSQRERGQGQPSSQGSNKGSNGSLYEPKSVADLTRFWAETTSSTLKLNRSGASNQTVNSKRRSGSTITLESPRSAFAPEQYSYHPYQYQPHQYQSHQHHQYQKRAPISKTPNESAVLPNGASNKGSQLSMVAEARSGLGQSQSRLLRQSQSKLRQSQRWEGGVESVPHQPVRELRGYWESLHRDGM